MKKLFNWMMIATVAAILMTACTEEETPNNSVAISGVPATAVVDAGQSVDPVTATITAADGLSTLVVTKDGATRINNFDLRWEQFLPAGQLLTVSAFYKTFNKPIEMVQFLSDPGAFQPRNVGKGMVAGIELEMRKSLAFVSPSLKSFFFNFNGTLTNSKIQMSEAELVSRKLTAREGEKVVKTRDMSGQAPYIINTGLSYTNQVTGFEAGVFYNVQGATLNYIGFGNRTDTYTVPFHAVNLSLNKTFGANEKMKAGINVQNLLNQSRQEVFRSFNAEDQVFSSLNPGTLININFSYAL